MDDIQKHYTICETSFNQEVMSHQSMISFLDEKNKLVKKLKDLNNNQPTPQMMADMDKVT